MSTPPRKPRNPENIFRRGNEHNVRSQRNRAIAQLQYKNEESVDDIFNRFLQEGRHPSTFTYEEFMPGLGESAVLFNMTNNGPTFTAEEEAMEIYNDYIQEYNRMYPAGPPQPQGKKRSRFNANLNNVAEVAEVAEVVTSTPQKVKVTPTEPPMLERGVRSIQRFMNNNNDNMYNMNDNNNAKSTNGFGKGGRRTRRAKKQRRTQRKRRAHRK
jgi:hypothetical protein